MVSAAVSAAADETAQRRSTANRPSIPDARLRIVLGLFNRQHMISSADVAAALGLSTHMARVLLAHWVADGTLVPLELSRKKRAYGKGWRPYRRTTGKYTAGCTATAPTESTSVAALLDRFGSVTDPGMMMRAVLVSPPVTPLLMVPVIS